jgi:hypothetical protein
MGTMKSIYKHGDDAYIILKQKPISYFAQKIGDQPDMDHVKMYMEWLRADHVLRSDTHFMFCETIQDAEEVDDDMLLWDNTLSDGLEDM